jgi:hypothetical protein
MTKTIWVRPMGLLTPPPGTEFRVFLEQDVDGRPLRFVGKGTVYRGNQACLQITEASKAGRLAVELLREQIVDPVFWGSTPTLRLRP